MYSSPKYLPILFSIPKINFVSKSYFFVVNVDARTSKEKEILIFRVNNT